MARAKQPSKKGANSSNSKKNQQQQKVVKGRSLGKEKFKSSLEKEASINEANVVSNQTTTQLKQLPLETSSLADPSPAQQTEAVVSTNEGQSGVQKPNKKTTTYEGFDLPTMFKEPKPSKNLPLDEDFSLVTLFNPKNVPDMDRIQGNYGLQNLFRNEDVYLATHDEELRNKWVFWFQSPSASWGKSMKRLYTVGSFHEVQDVLGKMTAPGQLNVKAEVYVFKQGIRPDRLDNRNQKGGCWAAFLPVAMPDGKPLLNSWFEAVIYSITTGQLPNYKDIVGVKVAIRNVDATTNSGTASKDRLEVWTKAALNQDKQLEIGYFLKQLLKYNGNLRLTYMKHQDVVEKTVKPTATPAPQKNVGRRHTGTRYGRVANKSQPNKKPQSSAKRAQSIKQRALYRL